MLVACTDFADAGEAVLAARTVATLLDLLGSHAEHEDAFVMTELGRHSPALAASLQTDHGRLEGLQAELRALLPRTCSDVSPERVAAGQLLGRALTLLGADHLRTGRRTRPCPSSGRTSPRRSSRRWMPASGQPSRRSECR